MICDHYEAERCRSCGWIRLDYEQQLARKQADAKARLARFTETRWLAPVASAQHGFRNKAKMAAFGSVEAPGLGLVLPGAEPVDLCDCPLYPAPLLAAFAPIKDFIRAARIPSYELDSRSGELKFVILTLANHSGELMLRFVLRSQAMVASMRKHLPALQAALPQLRVVSANIQPIHQAVLEGETELLLGEHARMAIEINGLQLSLGTRSFLQTNPAVTAQLYAQAAQWCEAIQPARVLDLYCGIGGFAFHCAAHAGEVTGLEISSEAIEAATENARLLGREDIRFVAGDAEHALDAGPLPELLIVNPPRRGIGAALARRIELSGIPWLVYSSCNAETMAKDLSELSSYDIDSARVFDMFPNTSHYELMVLAKRHADLPAG